MFRVEMLPAKHGDCLLLQYGRRSEPRTVLIDGGPLSSYSELGDRLRGIAGSLDLVVATHLDADHLEGLVRLLQDHSAQMQIGEIWFNGWRHLGSESETLSPVTAEYLSALIESCRVPWNSSVNGQAIACSPGTFPVVVLEGGLSLTILSPSTEALRRLKPVWESTLREEGLTPGAATEAAAHLAASRRFGRHDRLGAPDLDKLAQEAPISDKSIPNGSSIALLAEFKGKRVLLSGDCPPGVLERSIQAVSRLLGERRLRLDAFKIAHHGSKQSVTNSLLEKVDCQNYLISTDGRYFGHPHDEAIARIIRHGGRNVNLLFNYQQRGRFWDQAPIRAKESFNTVYPSCNGGLRLDLL